VARAKEFEPERALGRAIDLFWSAGYEATSVQELLDAMGIGRGSLYATFGDKRALFVAALDRYREEAESIAIAALEAEGSPKEAIEAVFEGLVSRLAGQKEPRRGCLLANTAVELVARDPEVGERVRNHVARLEDAFERAIVRGQSAGEIPARHSPTVLARFLVNNSLGLRVLARTGAPQQTLKDVARVALGTLEEQKE
jgi:TetR/AcrR family transcriptional regulator, transcriptional repressor for nem operon